MLLNENRKSWKEFEWVANNDVPLYQNIKSCSNCFCKCALCGIQRSSPDCDRTFDAVWSEGVECHQ